MRASARAPFSPWIGEFHCPDCEEPFAFHRDEDRIPGLEDAFLQVVHDHTGDRPVWKASVFRRRKGQHYPEDVRVLRLTIQEQIAASKNTSARS